MSGPHAPRAGGVMLVAGELSGDALGAALIDALQARRPELRFFGVAGPQMRARGCEAIADIDALSIMGLAEVLPAIPRLLRLRARLIDVALRRRPALVVGIDAPDFNLGLERRLRARGLRTVHVVSPTVWAWRRGRVATVARAVERILCLFPFEPDFYRDAGVAADYIGHPLADELDASVDAADARRALALDPHRRCVAVLPGSRGAEIRHLMSPFAAAARRLAERDPSLQFLVPIARPSLRAPIEQAIRAEAPQLAWQLLDGQAREAMRAADAVLLASGTATLECLLLGRPMVVAYRGAPLTAWLMLEAGLLKVRHVSLANLLSATPRVPELLQDAATPEALEAAMWTLLSDAQAAQAQRREFDAVREALRCDAGARAAQVLLAMLGDEAVRA